MSEAEHTPTPWETSPGRYGSPKRWVAVKHNFPQHPYEGDLQNEWGIYPPLGEAGPVALVSGETDARFIVAACNSHDALVDACIQAREWMDKGGDFGELMRVVNALDAAITAAGVPFIRVERFMGGEG